MPAPPPISVLLPVRNASAHLSEALRSLSAQSFPDFEVIAVDDGSDDDSPSILHDWREEDSRVRVLAQEPLGLVVALERARSSARGEYLARMDADDIAEPERFEKQLALMGTHEKVVACGTQVRYFPTDLVRDGARRYETWLNSLTTPEDVERDLFVECPLAHPTFFMRAEAVEGAGGYRETEWAEDYDLILRLWQAGGRLANVAEALHRWRESPLRLSRTHPRYGPDAFRRCKVHYLKRTLLRGRDGVVVHGAGPIGKAFARELKGAGVALRAFIDLDPRKIGQEIHGVSVISPDSIGEYRGAFCVGAVGQAGARDEIRATLADAGWQEGQDFVAVA
jgi:glycosyltransferase involved in cell wall biosynthesis